MMMISNKFGKVVALAAALNVAAVAFAIPVPDSELDTREPENDFEELAEREPEPEPFYPNFRHLRLGLAAAKLNHDRLLDDLDKDTNKDLQNIKAEISSLHLRQEQDDAFELAARNDLEDGGGAIAAREPSPEPRRKRKKKKMGRKKSKKGRKPKKKSRKGKSGSRRRKWGQKMRKFATKGFSRSRSRKGSRELTEFDLNQLD